MNEGWFQVDLLGHMTIYGYVEIVEVAGQWVFKVTPHSADTERHARYVPWHSIYQLVELTEDGCQPREKTFRLGGADDGDPLYEDDIEDQTDMSVEEQLGYHGIENAVREPHDEP